MQMATPGTASSSTSGTTQVRSFVPARWSYSFHPPPHQPFSLSVHPSTFELVFIRVLGISEHVMYLSVS